MQRPGHDAAGQEGVCSHRGGVVCMQPRTIHRSEGNEGVAHSFKSTPCAGQQRLSNRWRGMEAIVQKAGGRGLPYRQPMEASTHMSSAARWPVSVPARTYSANSCRRGARGVAEAWCAGVALRKGELCQSGGARHGSCQKHGSCKRQPLQPAAARLHFLSPNNPLS